MENLQNFLVITVSIAVLIFLVMRLKLPAFFALLLVSAFAGLGLGLEPQTMLNAVRDGMGGTLGFIAIVVGLGAMLGALLEIGGGVHVISNSLLTRVGIEKTPFMLSFIGFLIAIPVFFDVGLIILMPMIFGLARQSGKSLVYYALPLAAGLAAAHAFIPPTPGPIAVAELFKADLGWVIFFGALTALPAAVIGGPLFVKFVHNNATFGAPPTPEDSKNIKDAVMLPLGSAFAAVLIPLVLIVGATITKSATEDGPVTAVTQFIGHPFIALMIALIFLYTKLRFTTPINPEAINDAMVKSLEPAAAVILVTGAGGAFKQVLIESGAGSDIANAATALSLTPIVFGFIAAAIVRIMQGSATVAMITGAGLTAPLVESASLSAPQTALVVISVAAGATAVSHVNVSGFWLVNRYLGLSTTETFKTWTASSTLVGVTGFICVLLFSLLV